MRSAFTVAVLALLLCLAGCEVPAQTFWSPDGSRAAYVPGSNSKAEAVVVDAAGTIVERLGRSTGGCAWSADSRTLYFAAGSKARRDLTAARPLTKLLPPGLEPPPPATRPASDDPDAMGQIVVSALADGRRAELFRLDEGWAVWYMLASPDGAWLAVAAQDLGAPDEQDRNYVTIFAFSLRTRNLHAVSVGRSYAMAFTGPSTLAYVQPVEWPGKRHPSPVGEIVEVVLDDHAAQPARRRLATALSDSPWIEALGEDVLFTTRQVVLPEAAGAAREHDAPYRLYRYMRSTGMLDPLAEDVGALFRPSPDGRLILFQRFAHEDGRRRCELAVLDLARGRAHALCDLPQHMGPAANAHTPLAAYPAWRAGDQLSFLGEAAAAPAGADGSRQFFDLALYRLTDRFEVQLVRVLSANWPAALKPSAKVDSAPANPANPR